MTFKIADEKKEFPKASEGQHIGLCRDFIGPWEAVDDYDKDKPYPIRKVAYVWQINEKRTDGKPFEVHREFTLTFGKKANLRKFIGTWRGKQVSDQEAKDGVDIDFTGRLGYLSLEHKEKRSGGIWVDVAAIMPAPAGAAGPTEAPYARAEFWKKRIEEDETKSRKLQQDIMEAKAQEAANAEKFPAALGGLDQRPAALDEPEDDLPF